MFTLWKSQTCPGNKYDSRKAIGSCTRIGHEHLTPEFFVKRYCKLVEYTEELDWNYVYSMKKSNIHRKQVRLASRLARDDVQCSRTVREHRYVADGRARTIDTTRVYT